MTRIFRCASFKFTDGMIGWLIDEPEILWLAKKLAIMWMVREYNRKGKIKGGPWNKGSGIIGEIIFQAMLNHANIPHICSMPLLDKDHPVNVGKNYDVKIGFNTIDIKTLPAKKCGESKDLRVNHREVEKNGPVDIYILIALHGDLTDDEINEALFLDKELEKGRELSQENFNQKRMKLDRIMDKISKAIFIGWASKEELIKNENLRLGRYGDYYSLKVLELSKDFIALDRKLNVNFFYNLFNLNSDS